MVRAKMQVTKVASTVYGQKEITLNPVYDRTIPRVVLCRFLQRERDTGRTRNNPPAAEYLALGESFYVDFYNVKETQAAPATTAPAPAAAPTK